MLSPLLLPLLSLLLLPSTFSFLPPPPSPISTRLNALQESELEWSAFDTLIRRGPPPFVVRVTKPAEYLAAVDKYMQKEGCSVGEAQGNCDYYFADANSWALDKNREKATGIKVNYAKPPSKKDLVLRGTWAAGVFYLFGRVVVVQSALYNAGKF